MKRTALTDNSGRWFDRDAAQEFEESTQWDGSNHISCATGSQWHHEALYYTASGKWILHTYSNYHGVLPAYTEVSQNRAAAWLVTNGYDPHPACEQEYANLEIK